MKEPRIISIGWIEGFNSVKRLFGLGKFSFFVHREWKNLYVLKMPSIFYISILNVTFFWDTKRS